MPSADLKAIPRIALCWCRHSWSRCAPVLLAGLLSLGLWLSPAAAQAAPFSTSPSCAPVSRTEVEDLFERWNAALASGDAATVAALYSDDALLLPTLSDQPRDTPEAIRDYFEGFLSRAPQGRIDSRQIRLGCNEALDAGTYSFRLAGRDGGPPEWVRARYTFVYERGPEGWRIQHHHSSLQPPG